MPPEQVEFQQLMSGVFLFAFLGSAGIFWLSEKLKTPIRRIKNVLSRRQPKRERTVKILTTILAEKEARVK